MRKRSSLIVVVFLGLLFIFASAPKNKPRVIQTVEDMNGVKPHIHQREFPLHFIANKGQVNEKAAYYARASGYTLWMTKQGLVFDSKKAQGAERRAQSDTPRPSGTPLKRGMLSIFVMFHGLCLSVPIRILGWFLWIKPN